MIELVERRRLFHFTFVSNGVLNFPGTNEDDDLLTISVVGSNYRAEANDGFTQDVPIAQVTVGISILGGSGNDVITMGAGVSVPTTLDGGAGEDTINGGAGRDLIFGGSDSDVLLGNGNRDRIDGGAGSDTLSGGTKNDTLIGGLGGDFLVGSAGAMDQVSYEDKAARADVSLDGVDNDGVSGEGDNIAETCEAFVGGSAGDFFRGSGKANVLIGGAGNDTLIGGSGDDSLFGGIGEDSLDGQSGDDFLESVDQERDILLGGSGTDDAESDANDLLDGIP